MRNRLGNIKNPYQGDARKVLTVCSAGLLRSPTAANVLHREFGYNTRSCGTSEEFALIPLDEALAKWADQIVFMSSDNFSEAAAKLEKWDIDLENVFILAVPDKYNWGDPKLEEIILSEYNRVYNFWRENES